MSLYFTKEHEWVRVEGDTATVGISDHAQEQLGDIVFAEVPETGRKLSKGQEAAVVESVKAASDIYSPVSGEVIDGNSKVADDPSIVNNDPEGEGWFFKLRLDNPGDAYLLEEIGRAHAVVAQQTTESQVMTMTGGDKPQWIQVGVKDLTEPNEIISTERVEQMHLPAQFVKEMRSVIGPGTTVLVTQASVTQDTTGRQQTVMDADDGKKTN